MFATGGRSRRVATLGVLALTATLGLSACSKGGSTPAPTATADAGPTGSGSPSSVPTETAAPGPVPAWQQVGNFDAVAGRERKALIKVYPLQRIEGRLLLTVDIVAQGTSGQVLNGYNYFGLSLSNGDLSHVSLVDTTDRVRYGALRAGAGGKVFTSNIGNLFHPVGTTYRVGGFFPDPGPGVTSMGVDLQLAGIAPSVPIVDGGEPATGLVTDPSTGATPVAGPSVQATTGGDGNGPLVTWPTSRPGPDAHVDKHDLIAKVVGGTVNEGGNRREGIVTLNADLLFAFNSAELSSRATGLIAQARAILTAKADPAHPVSVIGYTDSKGTPTFNQTLSQKRATAAATALRHGGLGKLKLTVSGRGESEPVEPNTAPGGGDNPRGRALNRRVEITYVPKPPPAPTATPTPVSTATPLPGAGSPAGPAVTLPPRTVRGRGSLPPALIGATVAPIVEDGTLSLISVDLTAQEQTLVVDAFTGRLRAATDIAAFTVVDPATKRVYLAAYDRDDRNRVMGTYTHRLTPGQPEHYAFYAAALPAGLSTATIDLDQLGAAKNVTVVR